MMARKPRHITLHSPVGGLVRRTDYQSQPPYTTPDCSNVRPFDPLEGRERVGSRPGMSKSFATQFGGGKPIQALESVSVADDDGTVRDVLLVISEGMIRYTNSSGTFVAPSVETLLVGKGVNNGYFETLGAGGADVFASWSETAGSGSIEAETNYRASGAYSAKLTYVTGLSSIVLTLAVTAEASCTLTFWTRGDGSVDGRYNLYDNSTPGAITATLSTGVTGTTWTKIGLDFDIPSGCTSINLTLYSPSSAGSAWFDDVELRHRASTSTAIVSASKVTIPAVGMLQKFYISDRSTSNISGTEGVVTSGVLSDYSVSDWTALGIDTSKDFLAITSTQLDELNTTRSIDFTTAAYITLNGSEVAEGTVSYLINRANRSGDSGNVDSRARIVDTGIDNMQHVNARVGDYIVANATLSAIEVVEPGMLWIANSVTLSAAEWGVINDDDLTNLLSNGGFETAGAGDPDIFGSWTEQEDDSGADVIDHTASPYAGSHSCQLQYDSGNAAHAWVYQDISVTPGLPYVLAFWAKSLGGANATNGYLIYDNSNAADIVAITTFSTSTAFAQKGQEFVAPAGCTSVRIWLRSNTHAIYDVVYDDVRVYQSGGTAGTYSAVYLITDSDVADWTDYGITVGSDTLSYYDSVPNYYDNLTINEVTSIGLIVSTNPSGTAPFEWTVTRLSFEGDDGLITNANNKSRLSSSSYSDWTAITFASDDTITLTRPEKTFTGGTFAITSVAAGGVTITDPYDEIPDGSEYLYQIGRKIQVFDPDTGVLSTLEETDGSQPLNCGILSEFRGRLLACYRNTWYTSRINDPTDWDYGADDQDPSRAVAGGVAEAADVPDPITAAFSHTDEFFVFGCHGSMWLMRGDPGSGGEIDQISKEVGIVGSDAWCHLDDGTLVFLSRAGIYLYGAGDGGYAVKFSEGIVPEELKNVDGEGNVVSMCYDFVQQGIHLFTSPTDESTGDHWWIDWRNAEVKSLWPAAVPDTMQPFSVIAYAADPTDPKRVILGCHDGYLREFDTSSNNDDGTQIVAYMKLGPFRLAEAMHDGIVTNISAVTDEDSATLTWQFRGGDTGEAAVDSSTALASGTFAAGWNNPDSSRVRSAVGVFYVAGPATSATWALESIEFDILPGGRMR